MRHRPRRNSRPRFAGTNNGAKGSAAEFYDAIVAALELIGARPEIGTSRPDPIPTRQLLLQRFPYKVVYRVRQQNLYIVAFAHTRRRPGYWRNRP